MKRRAHEQKAILIGSIVWGICSDWNGWSIFMFAFFVMAVLISLIVIACCYIGVDGYVDVMHVRYGMLTYQYENNIYDNDNDLGKRELMEDIRNWNEDLAWNKRMQRDFWIGIYIPDIYNQFESIKLE